MKQTILYLGVHSALLLAIFASQASTQTPLQVKGVGWAASTKLGPALATDGNNAYIAWVDSATSDIYFATLSTATNAWFNPQSVAGIASDGTAWTAESSATPGWGYDGSTFYLFWKGKSDNDIWFSEYSDGTWSAQARVEGSDPSWTAETNVSPSGTFVSWPVTLFWKGASSDKVWVSSFDDLTPGWTPQEVVSDLKTNAAPGSEASPNMGSGTVPIFLKSASNDNLYAWLGSTSYQVSGAGWAAETTKAPAAGLADDGFADVVFWKGKSTTSIWYSYNTGNPLVYGGPPVWSLQATVKDAKTNAAPSLAVADGPSIDVSLLAWKNASDDTVWYLSPFPGPPVPTVIHNKP
jgi:hypothetical protein